MLDSRVIPHIWEANEFAVTLFTVQEILEITGAKILSGPDPKHLQGKVRRVCTDSRAIRPGDLFLALAGERFDGHEFVEGAIRRGAVGAIVQDRFPFPKGDRLQPTSMKSLSGIGSGILLGVSDTLRAYQELATYHRGRFGYPVVAVTGSNGKTTTKEMVAQVLARQWKVLKTEGNLNNRIGVPQTLLRLSARHEAAVVEMGVDQRGQTTRLCEIANPTIGVITNIGPDHLEFFGSLDGSAQAKAELVDWMPADGAVVLNADDAYFDELSARASCRVVSFGTSDKAQVRAVDVVHDRRRGMTFRLVLPDRSRHPLATLRVHGVHNLRNALAAAAVGFHLGMSGRIIADGLARFRPASMRSQLVVQHGVRILNDCYNANPASMKAALDVLVELGGAGRTIAVLGDMLELGSDALDLHREVGAYAAGIGVSCLIAVGSLGREIAEGARAGGMAPHRIYEQQDALAAGDVVKEQARLGDVVLIKASRGMRMECILEALAEPRKPAAAQP